MIAVAQHQRPIQFEINPFSREYLLQELEFYGTGFPEKIRITDRISFDLCVPRGRLDDYLNKNMRFMKDKIPRLKLDGRTWMSLTPMEIQSAAWAIMRSYGTVLTAGLGLGYFALRAAANPLVTKVIVYEREKDVIQWFNETFEYRNSFWKIEVRYTEDARKDIKGQLADFVFMDIYETLLPDECVTDARLFLKHNGFREYVCWGWELAVFSLLYEKKIESLYLPQSLINYFQHWMKTPYHEEGDENADRFEEPVMLANLARPMPDIRYCRRLFKAIKVNYE